MINLSVKFVKIKYHIFRFVTYKIIIYAIKMKIVCHVKIIIVKYAIIHIKFVQNVMMDMD